MSPRGPGLGIPSRGPRCRERSCDPSHSGIGPILWQPAPGPGPASVRSAGDACDRGTPTDGVVATVSAATAHPTGWHGGIPTGRPWDFALGTSNPEGKAHKARRVPAKGLCASAANRGSDPSLPDPVPRIWPTFTGRYQPAASSWVRRPGCRKDLPSRSEAPRAATVTRIAFGRFTGH